MVQKSNVVWKVDRLARNSEDHHMLRAALYRMGIELRSATEPISATPAGKFMESIFASVAQLDNDIRTERSVLGVKLRTEEGGWAHIAPLGYKNIKDIQRRPTIEPTEQAPLIAKWMREYIRGGYSLKQMNQLAYDMGIRSRTGKRLSYQQSINVLRNPIYAGIVKTKLIDSPVKGIHEPIITVEEHEAILERLNGKKKVWKTTDTSDDWRLRGLVLCSECGHKLTGSAPKGRSKNYPMYHCPKCRTKTVGHRVSVARETLHKEFEEVLEAVKPTEDTMKLFREALLSKWNESHKEQRKQQVRLQETLTQLYDKKQRVLDLFIDGKLSVEEKQNVLTKTEADIVGTELKLSETKSDAVENAH